MARALSAFVAWAHDIRSTRGFVLRAFICSTLVLLMAMALIVTSIQLIHPLAPLPSVTQHYLFTCLVFMFTIPPIWVWTCSKGLGRWYVSYLVGVAHALAAVVVINTTRFYFIDDMRRDIYYDAQSQAGAFAFVMLIEFAYFWVIAALASMVYVALVAKVFPTMATWFVDDPMVPDAPVSPSRPPRAVRPERARASKPVRGESAAFEPLARPVSRLPLYGAPLATRVGLIASGLLLLPVVLLLLLYAAANLILDAEREAIDRERMRARIEAGANGPSLIAHAGDRTLVLRGDSCVGGDPAWAERVCLALRSAALQEGTLQVDVDGQTLSLLAARLDDAQGQGWALQDITRVSDLTSLLRTLALRSALMLFLVDLGTLIFYLRHEFGAISSIAGVLRSYQTGNLQAQPRYLTTAREVHWLHKSLSDFRDWVLARDRLMHLQIQLDAATKAQSAVAPPPLHSPYADVWGSSVPALNVGGDFFDYFWRGEHEIAFVVADVSDKGLGSACFGLQVAALIRAHAEVEADPARVLTVVNRQVAARNGELMFATTYLCFVDLRNGLVRMANAGHEPMLRVRQNIGQAVNFDPDANGQPPLGVFEDHVYHADTLQLRAGDTLLLYTDGASEARDVGGSFWGRSQLIQCAAEVFGGRDGAPCDLRAGLDALNERVNRFCAPEAPQDDLTFVALRYRGAPAAGDVVPFRRKSA